MFGLIEKKKEFHARLSGTNTPVQEAKASRKFVALRSFRGVKSESSVLQNGVSKFRILQKLLRFYFFQRDSSQ